MNRLILFFLVIQVGILSAQPVFNVKKIIAGHEFYPDEIDSRLWYYSPGYLSIAEVAGKPQFSLLITRFTGSHLMGDQGTKRFTNILQFKVVMQPLHDSILKIAELILGLKFKPTIVPIPISNTSSKLIYQDIKSQDREITGDFESATEILPVEGYWKERNYTIRLSNEEAQLLELQLTKGLTHLSFTYEFFANGVFIINKDQHIDNRNKQISTDIEILKTKPGYEQKNNYGFYSNSFNINVDLNLYPGLVRKIDINAHRIPADYAALDIRCYTFKENLRTDLDARKIEIEASGISSGSMVKQSVLFSEINKDIVSHAVRFPFAVRTDKKYRYRVIDIFKSSGPPLMSTWKEVVDWNWILDITK